MPVTRSRNGLYDLNLDQTNTARFLFGEDETNNFSGGHPPDDSFPTLVRRDDQIVSLGLLSSHAALHSPAPWTRSKSCLSACMPPSPVCSLEVDLESLLLLDNSRLAAGSWQCSPLPRFTWLAQTGVCSSRLLQFPFIFLLFLLFPFPFSLFLLSSLPHALVCILHPPSALLTYTSNIHLALLAGDFSTLLILLYLS